jgi:uncharacterized membrane protein YhaH (DUF805 family)
MDKMFDWYLKVIREYANFKGRATRSEFWYFTLVNFLVSLIINIVGTTLGLPILGFIYAAALFVPSVAVGTRRLHDIGKSGWWQLIGIIPVVGWILLIIWFATKSAEDNQYGKKPIIE